MKKSASLPFMHLPLPKIAVLLLLAAGASRARIQAQITTNATSAAVPTPVHAPDTALGVGNNPLGDLPMAAALSLSTAIKAAMGDPAVMAAQEKFKTQMNLGVAMIREFINQNPTTKAFMADHPALGAYLATRAVQNLAANSVPGAAPDSGDAILAGLPPETVATLQALVKAVQANRGIQAEMQKGLDLGLAFNQVLRETVSKDAASKALVEKYPAAFNYLSTTYGVLPPASLPPPPARSASPLVKSSGGNATPVPPSLSPAR